MILLHFAFINSTPDLNANKIKKLSGNMSSSLGLGQYPKHLGLPLSVINCNSHYVGHR